MHFLKKKKGYGVREMAQQTKELATEADNLS